MQLLQRLNGRLVKRMVVGDKMTRHLVIHEIGVFSLVLQVACLCMVMVKRWRVRVWRAL